MNTLSDLIKELITATSADKVAWHPTYVLSTESYECTLGAYTIQITRPQGILGGLSFGTGINVLDANRNTIITATEGQMPRLGLLNNPLLFQGNSATPVGPEVSILFDTVSRKLGSTSTVISTLLNELKKR